MIVDIVIRTVLVLYSGGTIGMFKNEDGVYVPEPDKLYNFLNTSEMHDPILAKKLNLENLVLPYGNMAINYNIEEYNPLLDSSNMGVNDWIKIAKDIEKFYDKFDGFVILHGTDTLAYTSSALSFMLQNLNKPVILTAAQIPIYELRTDARNNFVNSLILAANYDIPEVCVFFDNKLLRGNRVAKISSMDFDAFDSPNYPSLGTTGTEISVDHSYVLPRNNETFQLHGELNSNVAMVHFFPTISEAMIEKMFQPPVEGAVLMTYGAGNVPSNRAEIMNQMKNAVKRGVVIVNISQCRHGSLSISYETGKVLEEMGIIAGNDMTPEAALTKLTYILSFPNLTYEEKVQLLKTNLRGEMKI